VIPCSILTSKVQSLRGSQAGSIEALNSRWAHRNGRGDRAYCQDLIELRNALGHGNQVQLDRLRARGIADTVTWARARLPGLDRTGRALDRIVWNHLGAHLRKRAVVKHMGNKFRVGTTVRVPWGLNSDLEGEIIEIWGDPPTHVRVRLLLDGNEDEPLVLLLSPSALTAA